MELKVMYSKVTGITAFSRAFTIETIQKRGSGEEAWPKLSSFFVRGQTHGSEAIDSKWVMVVVSFSFALKLNSKLCISHIISDIFLVFIVRISVGFYKVLDISPVGSPVPILTV